MARSKSDQAFDERIAKNSEELRELLTDLYGEQAEEAFQNLTELMKASHAARPADLKRLDTKRLADPELDPFNNQDTTSEWKQTGQNTTKDSSSATNNSKTFNSNAPQINMSGKNMEDYWNTGVFADSEGSTTTDGASTSLADYIGRTHGLTGASQGQALREWLDLYVNPLLSLFDDLEPCFSQLYTTGFNGL